MNPLTEYTLRLTQRRSERDAAYSRVNTLAYARLATGGAFLVLVWQSFTLKVLTAWFAVIPVAVFIILAISHERQRKVWKRARQAAQFYERGLDRLENRWQGKGNPGSEYEPANHLYAKDVDLFGDASLFELLCTVTTRSGEKVLAQWLSEPAAADEIRNRQTAVEELRNNLALREDLALIGEDIREKVHPEFLKSWANDPPKLQSTGMRILALLLVAATIGSAVAYGAFGAEPVILLSALFLEAVFGLFHRTRVKEVIDRIDAPVRELRILGQALGRLERENFSSEHLRKIQTRLAHAGARPTQDIARLVKIVDNLNQRRNEFFMPIAVVLLWGTQFAYAIEAWRLRCGREVEGWMAGFAEFEALCALSGYAYEHPGDPFPEIADTEVVLEGVDLRHPLVPESECVPNSLALGGELQLLLVSGSNMSGKSTLLRTVGSNTVLALAGGPVRAKRMKVSVVAIGATLRVQDSLQAGVSRFYAEIQRLHDTMDLTSGPRPVLFLLDEILHGTNSHDRAIGAEAVVRGLLARGAIGLVTTHDLALTRVAESLAPQAKNVHFQDELVNGRMSFDYVLHPGVVQKSNALELMRAVGLKV